MRRRNIPEQKNAIIIEDKGYTQYYMRKMLEKIGWVVMGQATNMDQALELIEKIGNLNVTLVLLDAHLSKYRMVGAKEQYDRDGGNLAQLIRNKYPNVTILGISLGAEGFQENDSNIDAHTGTSTPDTKKAIEKRFL